MQITYRLLLQTELDQACRLMNGAYARQKEESYFEWLYFSYPHGSQLWGAFAQKKLIGMVGVMERKLSNGAKAGVVMDIIVDESHRGKGIFSSLIERAIKDSQVDVWCSFTNYYGMSACVKGLGWKAVATIDTLVLRSPENAQFNSKSLRNKNSPNFAEFLVEEDYFRWRFEQSPLYAYTTQSYGEGSVVTKVFEDPLTKIKYGDIVYLKPIDSDQKNVLHLLQAGIRSLVMQNIKEITTWALPDTLRFQACNAVGFETKSQPRYLCVKMVNKKFSSLIDPESWDVQQADSEVF